MSRSLLAGRRFLTALSAILCFRFVLTAKLCFKAHAAAVTLLIGLRNWNHSLAKSGEMTGAARRRRRKRSLQGYFSSACQSTSKLQDCKDMLPIGTLCKPMLPNPNGWRLADPANPHESTRFTANLCFQPCKALGEVTAAVT